MKLNKLSINDKEIFSEYLGKVEYDLSTYAFENIYIWKKLFKIQWLIIDENLCVFFKDKFGSFLYLPPLGRNKDSLLIKKVFEIMDNFNKNKEISRIENVPEKDLPLYQNLGYNYQEKFNDYLCLRSDLAGLKGNKFKTKRGAYNYFIKHYNFKYLPFVLKYQDKCLSLYDYWVRQRKAKNQEPVYRDMLGDSRLCLKILLDDYKDLTITGRIVKVNSELKAFTFGFKLNQNSFCILYEITDLSIKGLSQFIFSKFCKELKDYKYINIMDDSGLANLRRVKLSYHPIRLIPNYCIIRNHVHR